MSGERNRRSLAFRGGGMAAFTGSSGNSWEAPACQDRHLNGTRPDQEEDADLGAKGPSRKRVEGDSTEPEAEEEEEDPEGGSWAAGNQEDSHREAEDETREGAGWTAGNGPSSADSLETGSGSESRKSGVEMRPQTLLQKHALFHASWLQEFPWLKFCQETGLMSCSWCHNIGTKNNDELVKGSRNYKRALLLRHHLSSEHGRNDPTKQEPVRSSENTSPSTNCSEEDYRIKPNENSYCYQLLQELDKQRKSGILCDVNIVVSGQVFRAHKNILVAGSRYFKTLYCLTKSEAQDHTTVTHLDVAAVQGFSVILDFLYSGNLLLTSQNAIEVMSVASYLQMTEVVQTCRAFIKDALNISIKQEAPDSVVVDYNKRQTVAKDGQRGLDRKPSNFWATSILSKLSIKASNSQGKEQLEEVGTRVKEEPSDVEVTLGQGCALVTPGASGSWANQSDSSNSAETNDSRAAGSQTQVFIWNEPPRGGAAAAPAAVKREAADAAAGSGRRKKTTTRRFVYNFPQSLKRALMKACSSSPQPPTPERTSLPSPKTLNWPIPSSTVSSRTFSQENPGRMVSRHTSPSISSSAHTVTTSPSTGARSRGTSSSTQGCAPSAATSAANCSPAANTSRDIPWCTRRIRSTSAWCVRRFSCWRRAWASGTARGVTACARTVPTRTRPRRRGWRPWRAWTSPRRRLRWRGGPGGGGAY
uniref:Zinc finger and BTB domain containing 10 n=1 Tax=Neogobius melanostomus TaxID=47308 RepID=A0A8C6S6G0_9GOBI